ncbi:hypothetical protein, partial [Salmonella enterica]|uniref:hypothetical protein n=1 Tax=Salmonella enterica TaxID=28901 RepID=UPI0020C390EF
PRKAKFRVSSTSTEDSTKQGRSSDIQRRCKFGQWQGGEAFQSPFSDEEEVQITSDAQEEVLSTPTCTISTITVSTVSVVVST